MQPWAESTQYWQRSRCTPLLSHNQPYDWSRPRLIKRVWH
jgi:hypothetical protein